jgi:hypothetical protein
VGRRLASEPSPEHLESRRLLAAITPLTFHAAPCALNWINNYCDCLKSSVDSDGITHALENGQEATSGPYDKLSSSISDDGSTVYVQREQGESVHLLPQSFNRHESRCAYALDDSNSTADRTSKATYEQADRGVGSNPTAKTHLESELRPVTCASPSGATLRSTTSSPRMEDSDENPSTSLDQFYSVDQAQDLATKKTKS